MLCRGLRKTEHSKAGAIQPKGQDFCLRTGKPSNKCHQDTPGRQACINNQACRKQQTQPGSLSASCLPHLPGPPRVPLSAARTLSPQLSAPVGGALAARGAGDALHVTLAPEAAHLQPWRLAGLLARSFTDPFGNSAPDPVPSGRGRWGFSHGTAVGLGS